MSIDIKYRTAFRLAYLALGIVLMLSGCKTSTSTASHPMSTYSYTDAMSNHYRVTPDSLVYEPIKPEFSSSGVADGGEPKSVKLSDKSFAEMKELFEALSTEKSHHLATRLMGCGTLTIQTGSRSETFFIDRSSPARTSLEERLISMLK